MHVNFRRETRSIANESLPLALRTRSTSNQRNSLPSRENTLTTTSSKKQKVSHTNPINGPLKGKGRPRFGRYSTIVHYSHRCDVCGQHFQALSKIRSVALTHHLRQCRGSLPPDIEMIETADIADELDDFDDVVDARFGHISELEVDMFLIAAKKKPLKAVTTRMIIRMKNGNKRLSIHLMEALRPLTWI